jgi:hypothetical protein
VPTILVLEDDASTRDALAGMLRDLFPRAHVIGARVDAGPSVAERNAVTLVLTDLAAVERIRRQWARGSSQTRDGGPDNFEGRSPGRRRVDAPATTRGLQAVLEPMPETGLGRLRGRWSAVTGWSTRRFLQPKV